MNDKITQWCKIIGSDLARLHANKTSTDIWPFTFNEGVSYCGPEFMVTLYTANSKLKKNYTLREISKMFGHPSKITNLFMYFQGSRKSLSTEQRVELANDLITYFDYFKKSPFYNQLNEEQVIPPLNFHKQKVFIENKIVATMLIYLEIVHPTIMRLGHEFHGPYDKNIVIRDFYTTESPKGLELKKINKLQIFEQQSTLSEFDFFNHEINSGHKECFAIKLNEELLETEEELNELLEYITNEIKIITEKTSEWNKTDWLISFAEGLFGSIRQLTLTANLETVVPNKVLNRIKERKHDQVTNKTNELNRDFVENLTVKSFRGLFEKNDGAI